MHGGGLAISGRTAWRKLPLKRAASSRWAVAGLFRAGITSQYMSTTSSANATYCERKNPLGQVIEHHAVQPPFDEPRVTGGAAQRVFPERQKDT